MYSVVGKAMCFGASALMISQLFCIIRGSISPGLGIEVFCYDNERLEFTSVYCAV